MHREDTAGKYREMWGCEGTGNSWQESMQLGQKRSDCFVDNNNMTRLLWPGNFLGASMVAVF
jgi:hypothetical protein